MNARILICLLILGAVSCAQETTKQAVELGRVTWLRDLADARDSAKPLFLLFQEVPG